MSIPLSDKIKMLPPAVRNILDIPEVTAGISKIREQYSVAAGLIFVGLLSKESSLADLENVLVDRYKIIKEEAKILAPEFVSLLKLGCQKTGVDFNRTYLAPPPAKVEPAKSDAKIPVPANFVKPVSSAPVPVPPPKPVATGVETGRDLSLPPRNDERVKAQTDFSLPPNKDEKMKKEWHPVDIEKLTDVIIGKIGLQLDPVLMKRLYKAVESYLKEIRNDWETKEMLTKPVKIGGLSLSEERANHIIQGLEEVEKRYHLDEQAELEKAKEGLQPLIHKKESTEEQRSFANQPDSIRDQLGVIAQGLEEKAKKEKVVQPVVAKVEEKKIEISPIAEGPVVQPRVAAPAQPAPAQIVQAPASAGVTTPDYRARTKITDIQPPAQVMGPVEELRALGLADWRRLGNPEQAEAKILNKISLLREENFAKGDEGRRAWQQSEVHQLYVILGLDSVQKKMPLAQVISERQKANQPTLTMEEFRAVMNLNKQLKY